jgi:two-component system, OmpR family, phosphate regulon response regulator PhoB
MDERVGEAGSGSQQHLIVVGDFLLDRETIRVWRGEKPLQLSMRQFRLMELFMRHALQPLSRRTIKEAVWGAESTIEETTVDAEIVRLRRAIGGRRRDTPIRTVRNLGYLFEAHKRPSTSKSESRPKLSGGHEAGR